MAHRVADATQMQLYLLYLLVPRREAVLPYFIKMETPVHLSEELYPMTQLEEDRDS